MKKAFGLLSSFPDPYHRLNGNQSMPKRRELREKAESKINNAKFEKGGPLSLCGNEESPFIFMEYSRLFIDEIPSEWN